VQRHATSGGCSACNKGACGHHQLLGDLHLCRPSEWQGHKRRDDDITRSGLHLLLVSSFNKTVLFLEDQSVAPQPSSCLSINHITPTNKNSPPPTLTALTATTTTHPPTHHHRHRHHHQTISGGLKITRTSPAGTPRTLVLRSGTHWLATSGGTVTLGPADSGLTIAGWADDTEPAVVSGAIPLTTSWKPYRVNNTSPEQKVGFRTCTMQPACATWQEKYQRGGNDPPPRPHPFTHPLHSTPPPHIPLTPTHTS
jgi:hypothetical protein